ncbi:hypothetical protein E2562_037734 [Oryza meyeriana var. granulata]|uniref:Uncharacterized protein n=1 Tax=Oryza meyeriana var. granulata TaxID=110450 RepID=A0A6G1C1X4_9ORYZ|nr:hypothetical protein E2562_037734 [Oryza meyeriana var. granulata]
MKLMLWQTPCATRHGGPKHGLPAKRIGHNTWWPAHASSRRSAPQRMVSAKALQDLSAPRRPCGSDHDPRSGGTNC